MKLEHISWELDFEGPFRNLLIKKWWKQASLDDCNDQLFRQVLCIFNSETKESISSHQRALSLWLEWSWVIPDFCIILDAQPQFEWRSIFSIWGKYIYFAFDETKPSWIRLLRLRIDSDWVKRTIWRRIHYTILGNSREKTALFRNSWGINALYIKKPPK
jgi:hypothetical protein